MQALPRRFFARPTLRVARELLGTIIARRTRGRLLRGIVVETEAYIGERDLACHASRGRTARAEILYGVPGTLYVYLIYGRYWCLNIVTERKNFPAAVLVRALQPLQGADLMSRRRRTPDLINLTSGPGKLCQAFGITGSWNGRAVGENTIFFRQRKQTLPPDRIGRGPRIGVEYAGPCQAYPWRFFIKGNPHVSRA